VIHIEPYPWARSRDMAFFCFYLLAIIWFHF